MLDAVQEEAQALGANVLYEEATTDVDPLSPSSIAAAAAAAKKSR